MINFLRALSLFGVTVAAFPFIIILSSPILGHETFAEFAALTAFVPIIIGFCTSILGLILLKIFEWRAKRNNLLIDVPNKLSILLWIILLSVLVLSPFLVQEYNNRQKFLKLQKESETLRENEPTCKVKVDKEKYKIGDSVIISWEARNTTEIEFSENYDHIQGLPTGYTSIATDSGSVVATVNSIPTGISVVVVRLSVRNNLIFGKNKLSGRCSAIVNVQD